MVLVVRIIFSLFILFMYKKFVDFVRDIYASSEFIPLHEPRFIGREKEYILDTIDSTFVSSVGAYVDQFERKVSDYTDINYAVATVNGTAALHIALKLANVKADTEVITQSLTFVATCNAIRYCGATPVFVDVERSTLGLSSESLQLFLDEYAEVRDDGYCWNKFSERKIIACMPMHTFGFPAQVEEIKKICDSYNISLIEDAAESLGSLSQGKHTGSVGKLAALSFNGNKIITTGGGGIILTNDENIAKRAKHITTTAKIPHDFYYDHDEIGFNYRLPNLNAAMGVAQMELLPIFIKSKRQVAEAYQTWGETHGVCFLKEEEESRANYWLNVMVTENKRQQRELLSYTNENGVMTRPAWNPMHKLLMNKDCQATELANTNWLADRLVNVPSSVNIKS